MPKTVAALVAVAAAIYILEKAAYVALVLLFLGLS